MYISRIISIIPSEEYDITPPPGDADDRDSAIHHNLSTAFYYLV
jgi:hypothetical protein